LGISRTSGVSFNAGTFAPKKYNKYTVVYTAVGSGGAYISTYTYFGTNDVVLAVVEIEFNDSGQDIRGELIS
jgi:hydrogenase maturation factor HypE